MSEYKEVRCPKCSKGHIARRDIVSAEAHVEGVNPDGSINWQGGSDIDWDSQRPADNPAEFVCLACNEHFEAEQLGIKIAV